ncbi:alpha/beta fold hydrolase [Roseateles aquatilis]|uniref:alpha/beta fold hydrolase n=1 Tax=Roseateles aquatilis TaxID=431061 RepID=UPI001873B480|nr:alpha/beta hydrolase [Roseateles aquatilis]
MIRLVLLPGMDGTGQLFGPFLAALGVTVDARVVRYPPSMASYQELVAFAANELPTDGRYIILGESFSGPIATALAAGRPAGLVGLVLCATFVKSPRPRFNSLRSLVGLLPAIAPPIKPLSWLLCNEAAGSQLPHLRSAIASVPPSTLRARLGEVLAVDASESLRDVSVPILYLRALHDRLVPRDASQVIQQLRQDVTVVDVEAPHFLLQTAPEASAAAVQRFATAIAATGSGATNPTAAVRESPPA